MDSEIYHGDMYVPGTGGRGDTEARMSAAARGSVPDIYAREMAANRERMGKEASAFALMVRQRYDYIQKSEAENKVKLAEKEFQVRVQEGITAPYGTAKSLYDEMGNLRADKYESLVAAASQKSEMAKRQIVNPGDAEEFAKWRDVWEQHLDLNGQAILVNDTRRKAEEAFNNKFNLAMEQGDYGSAGGYIADAAANGVINGDEAALLGHRVNRQGTLDSIDACISRGDVSGALGLIDGSEGILTPGERGRLRERCESALKSQRRADTAAGLSGLKPPKARDPLSKEDIPEEDEFFRVRGEFTVQQVDIIERMKRGEDVQGRIRDAMIDEARAFDPDQDYEKWKAGFVDRWSALGAGDPNIRSKISNALEEADKRRKKLGSLRQVEARVFESKARSTGEWCANKGRLEALRATCFGPDGEANEIWKPGSEWRKSHAELLARYGIPERSSAESGEKWKDDARRYYHKKYAEMQADAMGEVNRKYRQWQDTEEGMKAAPEVQRAIYEKFYEEETGYELHLSERDDRRLDAEYNAALQGQRAAARANIGNGGRYTKVDERQWPKIAGVSRVSVAEKKEGEAEDKVSGVYLPARYKGAVHPGDAITIEGEHGGYHAARVLGFTDADGLQINGAYANEIAFDKDNPKIWRWTVVRGQHAQQVLDTQQVRINQQNAEIAEYERRLQGAAAGAGVRATSQYHAQTMKQPGFSVYRPTEQGARYMGALASHVADFNEAGAKYNVDPKLLISIAIQESGRGTSRAARVNKNLFGIMRGGKVASFRSWKEGIEYTAKLLSEKYVKSGADSIEKIGRKYAPVGASNDPRNLNSGWVAGVSRNYYTLGNI